MDIYNSREKTSQDIYDSFNHLVFSHDSSVFFKMIVKINLYNTIKNLNGDILEFGVFKGASIALWLQLLKLNEPNALTSVIGFDFFDKNKTLKNLKKKNKKLMGDVLSRERNNKNLQMDSIFKKCNKILPDKLKLIKGDACKTCITFKNNNPGIRIKLLYLDMDLDKPTFIVLKNLWSLVVENGIIILDEYGYHKWDESNGVDRFLKTIKGKYILKNTNIHSPTLIIKKIKF